MLRIVTDTASDITLEQAKQMGVDIVPLQITFDDGPCPQETEQDFVTFYRRLEQCENLPVTSRPSPQAYLEIFLDAKEKQQEVVVLTVSGGLSGTIETALVSKEMADYDRIDVVDTHQAILTQRLLVEYAVKLRQEGKNGAEIAAEIQSVRDQVGVCGVVGTLKYLQKGGRIPASLALVGKMLNIKPVIVLEDTILKQLGKARGYAAGMDLLFKKLEDDRFDKEFPLCFGYTSNEKLGRQLQEKTMERYGLSHSRLFPIGGIIGTHCGTDCMAVAYMKKKA